MSDDGKAYYIIDALYLYMLYSPILRNNDWSEIYFGMTVRLKETGRMYQVKKANLIRTS